MYHMLMKIMRFIWNRSWINSCNSWYVYINENNVL